MSEYVIHEKKVPTGRGETVVHIVDPPQDVKMSWGINFAHTFPLSRQMSKEEFVAETKLHIANMQKLIAEKYPPAFFEEMRKTNFLDTQTFKNGATGPSNGDHA